MSNFFSNARFELLAVCCSWTRGCKANGPYVTSSVSSKIESAWTTVDARFKPGQRHGQKIANCLEVDFPAQRYVKFPRMQWGQIRAAWLRLLIKRELIELLFAFFFPHFLFTL